MLFNSFDFGLYLPIVFILYWLISPKRIKQQNILLLTASYFFYGIWDWRFLILIFLSSIVDYYAGIFITKSKDQKRKKFWLYSSILWNLGVLFTFKYFNFFIDNLSSLLNTPANSFTTLSIIVPVGLSFYTFQTMSYTIDVYKQKVKPTYNILNFMCFVSFFPQLVAGPIERAADLLPQFSKKRVFNFHNAKDGLRQILWGLFKKIVVADNIGLVVSTIYGDPESHSSFAIIFGALLFIFQLYSDFSGYADIAIGSARLFGFNLSVNFRHPYLISTSTEFWRKWHLTLSKWFQDYLFMPIIKWCRRNNISKANSKIIAIFSTMTLMGFWHGANWTFIIFGAFNGFLIIFESIKLSRKHKYKNLHALFEAHPVIAKLYLIPVLSISLIFFRSENIENAWLMIRSIVINDFPIYVFNATLNWKFIALVIMLIGELFHKERLHALQDLEKYLPKIARWAVYYGLILLIIRYGGVQEDFIYFQF